MVTTTQKSDVFAVVLAAGIASRFGATKQLAEIDGEPLVRRATELAATVCGDNSLLIVGHDWNAVAEACQPLRGFLILNDNYSDGLGTSIATAVRSVQHVAQAIVVLLADQPMITADHAQALCNAWSGAEDEIVATDYANTTGAPVLFAHGCFDDLARLQGDGGGRHLLSDERFRVRKIVFEPAAVDIDTPDDFKRISRNAHN